MWTCRALMPRPVGGAGHVERLEQRVEVGHRLAHAHDDDVRQALVGGEAVAGVEELFEDFGRGEVADDAADAGRAEDAAHAAADLGGDADGAAVGLLEQDALDEVAVGEADEQLLGAVVGHHRAIDAAAEEAEAARRAARAGRAAGRS